MREKAVNNEMKAHSKSLAEAAQMPEDLPTPEKSIRQIESEQKKRLNENKSKKCHWKNHINKPRSLPPQSTVTSFLSTLTS